MKKEQKEILSIPLGEIAAGENSRVAYRDTALSDLMVSMRQTGLLQPIGVKKLGANKYRRIFGNRRFMAAQKLGWVTIDAVVMDADSESEELVKNAIENIQRQDVSLPEQGRIFLELMKQGLTVTQIAARLGCQVNSVSRAVTAFQKIPLRFRNRINAGHSGRTLKEGEISASAALSIINIRNKAKLTQSDTEKLLDFATKEPVTNLRMKHIGRLVKGIKKLSQRVVNFFDASRPG